MSVHDCLSEYRKIAESMFGNPRFASMAKSTLYWPQPKYDHHPFESQIESVLRRYDKTFVDEKPRDVFLWSNTKCKTYVILKLHSSFQLNLVLGRFLGLLFPGYEAFRAALEKILISFGHMMSLD